MDKVWFNPHFANSSPPLTIFADRDGTLIRHVDYLSDPDQIELLPGVKDAVHGLIQTNIPFFILTNQSGVGRGYFSIEQVYACQRRLFELLELRPDNIAGWCIAPETPGTAGGYRKPSSRFVHEACTYLGAQLTHCHMIGDTLVDLQTAWNAGAVAWGVACGKPQLVEAHHAGKLSKPYTLHNHFADCIRAIMG